MPSAQIRNRGLFGPWARFAGDGRERAASSARRRAARRGRSGLSVAAGLGALLVGSGPATAAPAADPWETYVDAAVDAAVADEYAAAEMLLHAATGALQQANEDDPRPALTRWLLAYVDLIREDILLPLVPPPEDVGDTAQSVDFLEDELVEAEVLAHQDPGVRPEQLGEGLLPFARTIEKLGTHLDSRWKKDSQTPPANGQDQEGAAQKRLAQTELEIATGVFGVEMQIFERVVPDGNGESAQALALYGLALEHQQKLDDARDRWEAAIAVWDNLEAQDRQLAAGSRRLTLMQPNVAGQSAGPDSPLFTRILLARLYRRQAEHDADSNEPDGANRNFLRAAALHQDALRRLESIWPDHEYVGHIYLELGLDHEEMRHLEDAEKAYRRSLGVLVAVEGPKSENAANAAQHLANVLRQEGRSDEAREIETTYGIPPGSAGN